MRRSSVIVPGWASPAAAGHVPWPGIEPPAPSGGTAKDPRRREVARAPLRQEAFAFCAVHIDAHQPGDLPQGTPDVAIGKGSPPAAAPRPQWEPCLVAFQRWRGALPGESHTLPVWAPNPNVVRVTTAQHREPAGEIDKGGVETGLPSSISFVMAEKGGCHGKTSSTARRSWRRCMSRVRRRS